MWNIILLFISLMIIGVKHLFILCWKYIVHLCKFSIGLLVFLIVEKHFIFWYQPLSDIRFGNVISHLMGFFSTVFLKVFFFSTLVSYLHFVYFVYFYFCFWCFWCHFHYIKPTRRVNTCICTPNIGTPKTKHILRNMKEMIKSNIITVGDLTTEFNQWKDHTDRKSIWKYCPKWHFGHMDLVEIYRIFYSKTEECIFLSSACGMFFQDRSHTRPLNNSINFKIIEIISRIFSHHRSMNRNRLQEKKLQKPKARELKQYAPKKQMGD